MPIVSWVMARRLRSRVEALETTIDAQVAEIQRLSNLVEGTARPEAPAPVEAKPAPAAARAAAAEPEPTIASAPPPTAPVVAPPAPPAARPSPTDVTPPPSIAATPPLPPPAALPEEAAVPPPVVPPLADTAPADEAPAGAVPPPPRQPPIEPKVPPRRPPLEPPPPPPPIEPPPQPAFAFDWESFVGVKLFAAIAGVALLIAAVSFLRYSIESGWLQPPVRVAIGIVVAIALLVVCELKAARKYPATANAMDAAAIAILFATFFAAHSLWNLIPAAATFLLLALVTLTAVLLSIRRESLFIAVLGMLGGFATPVLLSSGQNSYIPLFAYLLLLNVGLAWVAYRRGWTILSVVSLALTTFYQWGWAMRYLADTPLSHALAIFLVFPAVSMGMYLLARSRSDMRDQAGQTPFEWTALAAAVLPVLFAVYLAAVPAYGQRYELLFGYLFLIDAGLLAIAIARGQGLLHAAGALATLLVFGIWFSASYVQGSVLPMEGFVALFFALYLAAPAIAARFDAELENGAEHTVYAAPLLLFAFPAMQALDPSTAAPLLLFPALFLLLLVLAWRSMATGLSALYFIGTFFALTTEAVWSARFLVTERLREALVIYGVFGLLFLAVPETARRRSRPLDPRWSGVVLLGSLAMLLYLAGGEVAAAGLWGMALLLAILNAALFVESAAGGLPLVTVAGGLLSWLVLFVWWSRAAAVVGVLPSLLVIVMLTLVMLGGHAWSRRRAAASGEAAASPEPASAFARGLWLALVGHLFLVAVAGNAEWALPPWPLLAALGVIVLAISTTALSERSGFLHIVSTAVAAVTLFIWRVTAQPEGWVLVALAAHGALVAFALAWIAVARRMAPQAAMAAGAVLVIGIFSVIAMVPQDGRADWPIVVGVQVVQLSLLLALTARFAWPWGATATSVLAGVVMLSVVDPDGTEWHWLFAMAIAAYVPFALYPLLLGARARDGRDPYIAAILAGAFSFFALRDSVMDAGYGAIVGVVPVALGAVTALHLRQLLRLQPQGARDLGRLALVAGAVLGFLTVAIPLQLDRQWITIGWALEGAAVAWLFTRIPHRGLLLASLALLGAVFVRLALNPEILIYEPRGSMRILNWYLYTYAVCAAAMFVAAWWLAKTDDTLPGPLPRPRHILPGAGAILLFILLNIEIADFYATGPDIMFSFGASIAQDLTYTIGWLIFGLLMLTCGIVTTSRAARIASVALITVTTFKCFLYDFRSLTGLYRTAAFVGLAISLALVSIALQKFVLNPEKERTS